MTELIAFLEWFGGLAMILGGSAAIVCSPAWWGFWRPDRRAARRFARQRARRIAALVSLGIPPAQAAVETDLAIAAEADRTLTIVREVA